MSSAPTTGVRLVDTERSEVQLSGDEEINVFLTAREAKIDMQRWFDAITARNKLRALLASAETRAEAEMKIVRDKIVDSI